ncbi:MFS transporter [Kitasatospora sp. NPDC092948]|uniref:MFS transporter n=1 Tax=Kitasatospora sp. NPDC092948 TaxID=3364088 RepID=UPI0038137180
MYPTHTLPAADESHPETARRPRPRRSGVPIASIGNALEWYDWNAYVAFAVLIGPTFFPHASPGAALLDTLAVFAVGFLFRPLGAALIGAFSDRHGRRAALTLSVLLMSGGSLLVAVTPSYQRIGLAAPLLLVLARAVQGMSSGGEVTAMSTYINEIAPAGRRGLWSSAIYVSTTLGTLASTLLAVALRDTLTPTQLHDWGWRLPFALGALFGLYAWYLRRRADESALFEAAAPERVRHPALEVLRRHPAATFRVVGFTVGTTAVYYTFAAYLPVYAQQTQHVPARSALWAAVLAQVLFVLAMPLFGMLSDRYGRRPLLLVFGAGFTVLSPALFALLGHSALSLFAVMSVALLLFGCCAAAAPSAMLEMFPTAVRSSGIGLSYSLTVALFGGTAPYLITYLSARGLARWFPWYVSLLALVSTVAFVRYRETADVDLAAV